ncbi:hypothetical protein P3L51_31665 [Streptomyces sp. PSRA5]|uniref:hypothetical protein n=1 Tax=Streptomyces panacea TaxID=3035064 RepID=UPI00339CFAFA
MASSAPHLTAPPKVLFAPRVARAVPFRPARRTPVEPPMWRESDARTWENGRTSET